MTASVDILNPNGPKRIVIVASNPAVYEQTGGPIGFWWVELSHPLLEFTERGDKVDIASPEGGALRAESARAIASVAPHESPVTATRVAPRSSSHR